MDIDFKQHSVDFIEAPGVILSADKDVNNYNYLI